MSCLHTTHLKTSSSNPHKHKPILYNNLKSNSMYTLSSINVGAYMLGEIESTLDRETICRNIINIIHIHDISIICTQEDILIGSSPNLRPEFESIYTEHGYTAVTYDVLDESHSETLKQTYTSKQVYLGNVIYVRTNLMSKVNPLLAKPSPCPACLAQIQFEDIHIANMHLCGGRFDDTRVFHEKGYFRTKLESVSAIDHHIVCGDFNATRCLGEPGGITNYKYPLELCKQSSHVQDTSIVPLWNAWQCDVVDFLYDQNYKSCFNDDQLEVIGETTSRGHYVVDWLFYDPIRVKKYDSHCEPMYGKTNMLSDHHMIMFTFSTRVDTEPCGKSYYV